MWFLSFKWLNSIYEAQTADTKFRNETACVFVFVKAESCEQLATSSHQSRSIYGESLVCWADPKYSWILISSSAV